MEKYYLQVDNWGSWEFVKDFPDTTRAKRYGQEQFPQNAWRILNRVANRVAKTHEEAGGVLTGQRQALVHTYRENLFRRLREASRRKEKVNWKKEGF